MADAEEQEALSAGWADLVEHACQCDSWGQRLESVEEYESCAMRLRAATGLSAAQQARIEQVAVLLLARAGAVSGGTAAGPALADVQALAPELRAFFTSPTLAAAGSEAPAPAAAARAVASRAALEDPSSDARRQGLLPPPPRAGLKRFLCVTVLRVGLPNALLHINPFLRVSVMDDRGVMLESQRTPAATETRIGERFVVFDQPIYVHVPYSELRACGAAIFFELVHFKVRKNKQSVRSWTLLEMDEVATATSASALGEANLEMYRKPMDPARRNFRLLTRDALYLECVVEVLGG